MPPPPPASLVVAEPGEGLAPEPQPMGGLFEPLRHRDFLVIWIGMGASNVGRWMQTVAQGALVYTLTESTVALGTLVLSQQLPMIALTLVGGSLADRLDRRWIIGLCQGTLGIASFGLAWLAWEGTIEVWHILAVAVLNGATSGLSVPTHQSLLSDLVPRPLLARAIALNSVQFHTSRSLGPLFAALLFAVVPDGQTQFPGSALCFLINGFSFGLWILGLMLIEYRPSHAIQALESDLRLEVRRFLDGLKQAFHYLRVQTELVAILRLVAAYAFLGMPLIGLLPAYAADVVQPLHAGTTPVQVQGHLMTASGLGAVFGALALTSWTQHVPRGRLAGWLALVFALGLCAISQTQWEPVAWGLMALNGICGTTLLVRTNTLVQLSAPDELRGRMLAIYNLLFLTGMGFGNLASGWLAQGGAVPRTLLANGALLAIIALLSLPRSRPSAD